MSVRGSLWRRREMRESAQAKRALHQEEYRRAGLAAGEGGEIERNEADDGEPQEQHVSALPTEFVVAHTRRVPGVGPRVVALPARDRHELWIERS